MTQSNNTIRIAKFHFTLRVPHDQWYIVRGPAENAEYWTGKDWQNAGPKWFETEQAAEEEMGEIGDE